jgi:hypothetical protein
MPTTLQAIEQKLEEYYNILQIDLESIEYKKYEKVLKQWEDDVKAVKDQINEMYNKGITYCDEIQEYCCPDSVVDKRECSKGNVKISGLGNTVYKCNQCNEQHGYYEKQQILKRYYDFKPKRPKMPSDSLQPYSFDIYSCKASIQIKENLHDTLPDVATALSCIQSTDDPELGDSGDFIPYEPKEKKKIFAISGMFILFVLILIIMIIYLKHKKNR